MNWPSDHEFLLSVMIIADLVIGGERKSVRCWWEILVGRLWRKVAHHSSFWQG